LAAVLAQGWGWDKEFFHTGAQQKEETMAHLFDPGYGNEPFRTLCQEYPGVDVYPAARFRIEWGVLSNQSTARRRAVC